jgi:CubicO group peptidase (beta-lactamase class C family)
MRPSSFRAVLILVLFVLSSVPTWGQVLSTAEPESVGMSSERLGRLTNTLEDYVSDERIAGAVAIVARKGKIAYLEAVGMRDLETSSPMATDSIFRIASQTKALTSTCIMILQERGQLLISDPLAKYMPEFANGTVAVDNGRGGYDVVAARRAITIRDLLTHTSGISYGNGIAVEEWREADVIGWYFAKRDEPIRETIRRMGALPASAHPGDSWIYGYNTDILGALVEVVSGRPFDVFLRDEVLEPLGMSDTHFYLPAEKIDRLVTVYSSTAAGGIELAPAPGHMDNRGIFGNIGQGQYVDGPRTSFSGGAGLLSTAHDYATFLQMMLNGGEFNGARILSPNTVKLMTVNHLGEVPFRPGQGFGLGFSVVTDLGARGAPGSVGEFGWAGAYHSTYWADPEEELAAVYLTQLIPAINVDDNVKFRSLLYQAIID